MSDDQFIAWWNSNWPDLAPTHQALHAWLAAREMLEERIAKAKAILPDVDNDIVREALWDALEGK